MYLRAAGEVDLATAGEIEAAACDLLERGFDSVVIDLRRVSFLDCSGIHALLKADQHARALNRRVAIVPPDTRARRILELTGVIDRLHLEPWPAQPDGGRASSG